MAFHMMQTIFTIFNKLLLWCKDVVQWKRLNMAHVLEFFKLANLFQQLVLQEAEQLAIDQFLSDDFFSYYAVSK